MTLVGWNTALPILEGVWTMLALLELYFTLYIVFIWIIGRSRTLTARESMGVQLTIFLVAVAVTVPVLFIGWIFQAIW